MDDFDWKKAPEGKANRFPEGVFGRTQWSDLDLPPERNVEDPLRSLKDLQNQTDLDTKLNCPRLFISHRQDDCVWALRVAKLCSDVGFYYWLDVLDPNLAWLGVNGSGTPYQMAIATAAIIEMGF